MLTIVIDSLSAAPIERCTPWAWPGLISIYQHAATQLAALPRTAHVYLSASIVYSIGHAHSGHCYIFIYMGVANKLSVTIVNIF